MFAMFPTLHGVATFWSRGLLPHTTRNAVVEPSLALRCRRDSSINLAASMLRGDGRCLRRALAPPGVVLAWRRAAEQVEGTSTNQLARLSNILVE